MAVLTFKEIHRGRDGATELTGGKTVSRYTRVFRATTDSPTVESVEIMAHPDCPVLGSIYDEDIRAACRRVRPRNESFSRTVWLVTANYSTEFEAEEDPLNDPVVIDWNTDQFQRPYHRDIDGKAILTGAGNYFDPPIEDDDSRWAVHISHNAPGVPSWVRTYRNAINDASFVVDGETVTKNRGKVQSIRIGKVQERNDITYRPFDLVLHLKDEDDEETWVKETLNHDLMQIDPFDGRQYPCVDRDGNPTPIPVPLTSAGVQIPNPSPDHPDLSFIKSKIFKEKDFSVLPGCFAEA